ncbi:unnamed protein product [Spirodela intermedia]|uniref:Peptidase A1 domain-containing protein n=1 Tax=Spirodela intermedia TaxID=51605 RepID=A0A7I8KFQ8_SPIIN|nr:unnamed protein product [Spirodela intermedia]
MAAFLLFSSLLLLLASSASAAGRCAARLDSSSDISILHAYDDCSPFSVPGTSPSSWFDTVLGMAAKDPARFTYLASLIATAPAAPPKPKPTIVPIAAGQQVTQTPNYVLRAKLGSPGQLMYMALDTSSDLSWVPCAGCSGCPSATLFNPAASSTFSSLDCAALQCTQAKGFPCNTAATGSPPSCAFNQSYGSVSLLATLSHDALLLASDAVPDYAFGCVTAVASSSSGGTVVPKQGLLGLGRGSMGLMAQAGKLYGGVFSYCLPSFKSYYFSGSLRLGPLGQPKSIRTTPLLRNPHRPSLYYVNLTGVSVGKTAVKVAPELLAFDPATGAGTVVDSGTVITRLVRPFYEAVRDEFRRQVAAPEYSSLGAYDTCFSTTAVAEDRTPVVTLNLEGMELVLPAENTLIHSSSTPLACLAMAAAPDNVNSVLNVIANLQQQNHRVLIDTANSRVGFARELCN